MKMAKRGLISILSFLVFLSVLAMPISVSANETSEFSDISGHWAEKSINKVVEEGLFKGVTDREFQPQGSMTRAMFITVLHRLAEKLDGPDVKQTAASFTDVPENAWYIEALNWAISAELTQGYGNGKFAPNDLLNREQITVLVVRFLESYMGYDLSGYQADEVFADNEQISSWAKDAVYKAVALGLIQGENGNVFNAKGTASRAVVAVITERFLTKSATLKAEQPKETPAPSATPEPTPTASPIPAQTGGGSSGGGGNTAINVTAATIQRNGTDATGAVITSGDELTVAVVPSNAQVSVRWLVYGKEKSTAKNYTVQALDVGTEIVAEVTGTGNYKGTVTSAATGKVVAAVNLSNRDVNGSPVVVAEDVVYKDTEGNEVTVSETDKILFSVTAAQAEVPEEEKDNVLESLQEQYEDTDLNIDELTINYFAIDAELLLESGDGDATVIHPVGETTLTLSKTSLGFAAGEDISQHVFLIGHTNQDDEQENRLGEVVEINGEQYVRVQLNGLSRIFIGNVPPLTVTFDTVGGSEIPAKKVKLGEITPVVVAPAKEGYFFIGWNADLNTTPIFSNITFTALWIEGAYIAQERLSLVDPNGDEVENYNFNASGSVKVVLKEAGEYDAELEYTLIIQAPEQAMSYVLSDLAEVAVQAKIEEAENVRDGIVEVAIDITDAVAKVITGNHPVFIKWFDENGKAIILEAVTVTVETDDRTATREKTFNVDRGFGTVEALLTADSDEIEDYYAYFNGNLSGSGVSDNYSLGLNASFSRQSLYSIVGEIDYANYSGIKLIFTAFEGETFTGLTTKASAYYWDANNEKQTLQFETILNEAGQLEVSNQESFNLLEMAGSFNNLNIYVTVEAGERSQRIDVRTSNLTRIAEVTKPFISTDQWSEVIEAFDNYDAVTVRYEGPDVILNKKLELKSAQDLTITSNLTIDSEGELKLEGTDYDATNVYVYGDITIANGGNITTNSQLDSQRNFYVTFVRSNGNITVASGGEINVPNRGYLTVYGQGDSDLILESGAVINIEGIFTSRDIMINGEVNIISDSFYIHGDATINGNVEVNGSLLINGLTTIQENGELSLTNYGNIGLHGKTYNDGLITVNEGSLQLSNIGYTVSNGGKIDIGARGRLLIEGTTLVNSGEIIGSGSISLVEESNAAAEYDNGIEYVEVVDKQTTSNYSRYKFVRDPEATVTGTIYESKIAGAGTVADSLTVTEIKVPDSKQK